MKSSTFVRRFSLYILICLLASCGSGDNPTPTGGESSATSDPGFPTLPTSALPPGIHLQLFTPESQTEIQAPGTMSTVPRRQDRVGYYFIGDGDEDNAVSFSLILPLFSSSGVFPLQATTPYDTGKFFDAKLDWHGKGLFNRNTEGVLTINQLQLQANGSKQVSGTFNFRSANTMDEIVVVSGSFNLDLPATATNTAPSE